MKYQSSRIRHQEILDETLDMTTAENMKQISTKTTKNVLTGGAKAASIIESFPRSGDCNRRRRFSTKYANQDRHAGTSRMMLVFTIPGSATLMHNNTENEC